MQPPGQGPVFEMFIHSLVERDIIPSKSGYFEDWGHRLLIVMKYLLSNITTHQKLIIEIKGKSYIYFKVSTNEDFSKMSRMNE